MKKSLRSILAALAMLAVTLPAGAQMIKLNGPGTLAGCPNIGYEHGLTPKLSLAGDVIWLPYMSDKHEEVFRTLQITGEVRYYFRPTNDQPYTVPAGWYLGGYAMYGDFNIGRYRHNDMDQSFRRAGWACSAGISAGWKYAFNNRWQMDINLGVGYAHLQYHKYKLGGAYRDRPLGTWRTRHWVGPTRFSISFGYVIDCACNK